MGALVPKTIRTYRWPGNPAPRVYEVPAGLHTAVGIPCNSWDYFIAHDVPILKSLNVPIIQSVIGRTEDEYVDIAVRLGRNRGWRTRVIERMSARHPRLYGDTACVKALEGFYRTVVDERLS